MAEGVRGADLVFACIGPAMEVYSRYTRIEDAEGREIPLGGDPTASEPYKRGFLSYVWETVGRTALGQILGTAEARARNGTASALEEDARLTALFLWTLQSTNGDPHPNPLPQGEGVRGNSLPQREETGAKGRASHPSPPGRGSEGEGTGEEADEEDIPDEDKEEETVSRDKWRGFSLIYDVVRRFAQPLGIHLDQWEDRIISTEKGVVRLLSVAERATQLFGKDGAAAVADRIEAQPTGPVQLSLFVDDATRAFPDIKGRGRGKRAKSIVSTEVSDEQLSIRYEATTLDRVHAAMLLQASGRANALRALLKAEQDRGPDFLRLANALSALYPKEGEEKRLLDAMLLAVPR
jgi:putative DNA methylase